MTAIETDLQKTRGFIKDLEQAEQIYRRLLGLTRNQSDVLRAGVSPELLELARAKEEELGRLGELEARMGPTRSVWTELRDRISQELRTEVQTVVSRVELVLQELIQMEEQEGRALSLKRDETIAQIRRLDSARKVRGAYGGTPTTPSLLDQKE